jgi:hypothetical protein
MLAVSLLSTFETLPVEPHPDLVAVQRPSQREMLQVLSLFGWLLPDDERFQPVPIGEKT